MSSTMFHSLVHGAPARRRSRLAPLAALLLGAAACTDSGITTPGVDSPPLGTGTQFAEAISLPQLQEQVSTSAVRVEVKFGADGSTLIAKEIEREDPEALTEPEKVEGPATAVSATELTIAGVLPVTVGATTVFRSESGDTLTPEEFSQRVQDAITAGTPLAVEAKRPAPAAPAGPAELFVATEVEIDDEASEPKLELNVDADNLILNDTPPPDAFLKVLGLEIQIRTSETELEATRPEVGPKKKFEGVVESVDMAASTLTLRGGLVVKIVEGTQIKADDANELATLAEVEAALADEKIVEAEGKGVVDGAVLVAIEAEFEIEEGEDVPDAEEVEGVVAAVDTTAGTVTLVDGQVLRIVEGTKIVGRIKELREVAQALDAQREVEVEAKVLLEVAGPPAVYIALKLKFETDDEDDEDGEFEGLVATADSVANTFTLADGTTIRVTTATRIDSGGDLQTLGQVARALDAGSAVKAEGKATPESTSASARVASEVKFETEDEDDGDDGTIEFEGLVTAADSTAGTVTVDDTLTVTVTETTAIDADGDLTTLGAVARALADSLVVEVEGEGALNADGALVATELKFETDADDEEGATGAVEFEGQVTAADTTANQFTLNDGRVVRMTADTQVDATGDLTTLAAVAGALGSQTVKAEGEATQVVEDGVTVLVATKVKFEVQ